VQGNVSEPSLGESKNGNEFLTLEFAIIVEAKSPE